jgi:hypothetical protein
VQQVACCAQALAGVHGAAENVRYGLCAVHLRSLIIVAAEEVAGVGSTGCANAQRFCEVRTTPALCAERAACLHARGVARGAARGAGPTPGCPVFFGRVLRFGNPNLPNGC